METLLELLKYTVPAIVVMLTAAYMIRQFAHIDEKKRLLELKIIHEKATLPIKLQAYERLALFLERISPDNMIPRIRKQNMSARDLQLAMLRDIRAEFEHNLSQQIYITPLAWEMVKASKEEMLTVINRLSDTLPPEAGGNDLAKRIFEFFMQDETSLPTKKAMLKLKEDVSKLA